MSQDITTNKRGLNLWQKLAAITKEVGHIEKTGKNSHFNYNFIEHSNVVAVCREQMFEYGVTVDLEALDGQFIEAGGKSARTVLHMRYYVTNADKPDETFSRLWFSEAMDQQDKGVNKALTAAEKNIFMKLFHISDVDLEADENEQPQPTTRKTPSQATRPAVTPNQARPANLPTPMPQAVKTAPGGPVTPPTNGHTPAPVATLFKPVYEVIGESKNNCPKCSAPMDLLRVVEESGETFQGERCVAKGCGYKRKLTVAQ